MNKVILMGRLTRDPEIRYTSSAEPMAVARYGLAVNRRFKREGEPDADFVNIVAFRRDAEFAEKWFKKGQMVGVVGRLQIRSYDNDQGQKQWVTEVVVDEQHFAESRASFEGRQSQNWPPVEGGYSQSPPAQQGRPASNAPSQGHAPSDSFFEVDANMNDDDLPF